MHLVVDFGEFNQCKQQAMLQPSENIKNTINCLDHGSSIKICSDHHRNYKRPLRYLISRNFNIPVLGR